MSPASTYVAATDFQLWTNNSGASYTGTALASPASVVGNNLYWYGAAMAIDINGDGYLDAVFSEAYVDSPLAVYRNGGGTGTLTGNSDQLASATAGNSLNNLYSNGELSGVDINNDGYVDMAMHAYNSNASANIYQLVVLSNNGAAAGTVGNWSATQYITNVFIYAASTPSKYSMTWADFNKDGSMDLYLSAGMSTGGSAETTGRIYYNTNGTLSTAGSYVEATGVAGLYSLAVDWNMDGAMDILKFTTAGNVDLYANNGTGASWAKSALATGYGANTITGVAQADYDWDGDQDIMVSRNGTTATNIITNNNQGKDGSELHLRILDGNGINAYFGNTVQLFDATHTLVGSQIINSQSGEGVNDATGMVNFYRLTAGTNYTVKMTAGVGGSAVTTTWAVTPGEDTAASVLTTGHTVGATCNLTGTGYDNTLIATGLSGSINGSGGWNGVFSANGTSGWDATGGRDIVDFSHATSNLTVSLSTGNATGYGTVTLTNIEGAIGGSANDAFTGSSGNNIFDGRGGDDTYYLAGGGHDTLVYKDLSATADGGNGSDAASDFTVGNIATVADADVIDLRDLLKNYTGTAYVYQESSGTYHLDAASSGLNSFLQVTNNGTDTLIQTDATGTGAYATLLTLQNTTTTLEEMIVNHNLIIG